MDKVAKKVGIWIRVSPAGDNDGESPQHHEARARKYLEMKGWEATELYDLSWVSGKSVMNHPECQRMLDDLKSGRITGLIFSNLTRLARNTRELLDFCDIFNEYKADLISISESIDTSSPAGKLLFTLMASLAQFERETISARVAASVPIRAELGKSLGGQAPYGYRWDNKQLLIDQEEAPIRKLMFELYLTEKRRGRVARMLNERGYRTRKGGKWSDTSIERLLTDPIAKGLRRVNYTRSEGKNKKWIIKPKEEWVFQKAPAIVSEDIWNQVNNLIKSQRRTRPRRKATHLFGSICYCHCGTKMYLLSNSPKYTCKSCRNKIHKDDLEMVFHEQLRNVLFDENFTSDLIADNHKERESKTTLLRKQTKQAKELKEQLNQLLELQRLGELPAKGFKDHYTPVFTQLEQVQVHMSELEEELVTLSDQVEHTEVSVIEAQDIHLQWEFLSEEDKKAIIEIIVEKVIVYKDTLEFRMIGLPKRNGNSGSSNGGTNINTTKAPDFKQSHQTRPSYDTLQKSNATMPLWLFQSSRQRLRMCARRGPKVFKPNFRASLRPD